MIKCLPLRENLKKRKRRSLHMDEVKKSVDLQTEIYAEIFGYIANDKSASMTLLTTTSLSDITHTYACYLFTQAIGSLSEDDNIVNKLDKPLKTALSIAMKDILYAATHSNISDQLKAILYVDYENIDERLRGLNGIATTVIHQVKQDYELKYGNDNSSNESKDEEGDIDMSNEGKVQSQTDETEKIPIIQKSIHEISSDDSDDISDEEFDDEQVDHPQNDNDQSTKKVRFSQDQIYTFNDDNNQTPITDNPVRETIDPCVMTPSILIWAYKNKWQLDDESVWRAYHCITDEIVKITEQTKGYDDQNTKLLLDEQLGQLKSAQQFFS